MKTKSDTHKETDAPKQETEVALDGATCSSSSARLAAIIARQISDQFYLCTDRGIGGDGGYSASYCDDDEAVEKLVELILPLLPKSPLPTSQEPAQSGATCPTCGYVWWTLESALSWIRDNQKAAMRAGWYIALGGGVLNSGRSSNDLDLVIMPRAYDADRERLSFLGVVGEGEKIPSGRHYTTVLKDGRVIEMAVVS